MKFGQGGNQGRVPTLMSDSFPWTSGIHWEGFPVLHKQFPQLGPPVVPFYPFLGEGSPTNTDYRKKAALILTSLLEDLDKQKS